MDTNVALSSVPKAAVHKPGPACDLYDGFKGRGHLHCDIDGAIVHIEQEGPEDADYRLVDGERCHGEVICNGCITSNTPTDERMCTACAHDAIQVALEADEILALPQRAAEALLSYSKRLRTETDPAKIRESISGLHAVEDVLSEIHRELLGQIERANAVQAA